MTAIVVVVAVIGETAPPGVRGAREHVGGRYRQDAGDERRAKKQGGERASTARGEAECVLARWDHRMSFWVI
jgi:hypothetical protein